MEVMDIGYLITVLGVILVSMTLHEAMHGFMAYYLGDDTAKAQGRLTLNPIKHIDPFLTILLPMMLAAIGAPVFGGAKPVPFNPNNLRYGVWGVALVALAGPLTNFILAFLSFGLYVLVGTTSPIADFLVVMVSVNLGFFVFNMLPIPPLDGSRVAYALAPDFIRRGMEAIERMGLLVIFVIVFMASGAIGNLMGTIIGAILRFFAMVFGV